MKTAETEIDEKENRIIQFLENSGIEMCVPEEKKENFFEKARENIVSSRRNSQFGDSKMIKLPSEQRLILDNSNLLTRRKSLSKFREDDKNDLNLLDKKNEYNSKSPINKLHKIFKEVQYFTPKSKFSKEIDCFADHTDQEEFN